MAIVLKFERGGTDYSLQDGDAGFQLISWTPKIARPAYGFDPEDVEEAINIRIEDSNHNNLAAEMQELHALQRWAAMYKHDRTEDTPVWLHAKLTNETGERRALVKSISGDFSTSWFGPSAIAHKLEVPLSVVRAPYWERTASRTFPSATPSAAASISYDYTATADIAGDAGARIQALVLDCFTGGPLARFWLGLRSANKHGTPGNFVNVWECEDGTNGTDASDVVDGTASGGDIVRVTPGTATWAKRSTMYLGQMTNNEVDNFGNFLWLLRTKVSAGTWEVQLRHGYVDAADADLLQDRVVEVTNTSWDYKEMGVQPTPLRDLQVIPTGVVAAAAEHWRRVDIWAQRTSGSGTLDIDCLCPVPVDEGWCYSDSFSLTTGSPGDGWLFGESPGGKVQAFILNGSQQPSAFAALAVQDFKLPVGDGRLICVYARDGSSTITDRVGVNRLIDGKYYERWDSLRGSE